MAIAPSRPHLRAQMGGAGVEPARTPSANVPRPAPLLRTGVLSTLAGGAAFIVDRGLRCLAAEGDAVRLAGLGAREVVGRRLGEMLDPLLASRLEPHCRLALDGEPVTYEHETRGRAYLTRGLPLHDDSGAVYAALVVTYDITDRHQAEVLRRRGEETFAALVEHAPFAVFVVDARLRLRALNQRAEVIFRGIEPLLGRELAELAPMIWPAPAAEGVMREFRRTLATGVAHAAARPVEAEAGPMAAYDWRIQRLTLPDGMPGVVCYAYDLTPMRDAEARLTLALDASGLGTFVWHVDEGRGEPDERARELLGLEAGEPTPQAFLERRIHPDDRSRIAAALARALDPAGPGTLREDVRVRRPDGTTRWLAITARTTFGGQPRRPVSVAGVVADIDDRKRIEASLRERDEQLTEADRRKDEFLATLAHELRNPLAPIRAGLELIRLSGDGSPAIERTRAMMERQVGHMVRLIDDLLDISRITSGKVSLQRRPTPIELLVNTAVEANRQALTAGRLTLEVSLPDSPICLDVDPTRGVQVLSNVIHNAVKFTDAGGRIALTAVAEERWLAITIADSGVGISAEMLPHVFDLFTQDRSAGDRAHVGLGIGLALARQLIEMHGGTIEARSDGPGHGSAFTIRLPIASGAVAGATAGPSRGEARPTQHRVVVIDDNLDAANAMALLIAALGGEARVAGDGVSGLEQVLAWRPTLVLLDIGMPGVDGYETCRRIRAAVGSSVVVVALTGWGQEQDKRAARHAGFDAHLTKPADPAALERLLAEPPVLR
jgi:two-component system CheB/CheR fusion protein